MRVLIAGDSHEPVSHENYIDFLCETYNKYDCDTVVHIGDITDLHGPSKYTKNTKCLIGQAEYELTLEKLSIWSGTFPEMKVCIGNHDDRALRSAENSGLSASWLKDYSEVWDTPNWDWKYEHTIDGVKYFHGNGFSGRKAPALDAAIYCGCSCVIGHHHSIGGVNFHNSSGKMIFGMSVGCGIDYEKEQFSYDRHNPRRPILGCGVVLDGVMPIFVPMI